MAANVPDGCPLTPRQFEVLQLLSGGLTGREVGKRLGITYGTVRDHSHAAFRQLGCHSTVQAISLMGRRGWTGQEPPEEATPLAVEHPALALYLQEFDASRWPHEPDARSALGMKLAMAGHRNRMKKGT